MEQRLERSDIRLILVCLALAAVSLLVGTHYFYDAFPEATIDFGITREEARLRGASFLAQRGLDVAGYRQAAVFEFDDEAKTFLERELGLEGTRRVVGDPVRLWRWSSRWFRPQQKEELRVQYTTAGDLVGFTHLVDEEAPGASLPQAQARVLAEQFLGQDLRIDLATLAFVEAETTQRPNRVDHTFTWKLTGFSVAEGTYRYRVGIQGDRVGSCGEFLKVPETWQREYRQLRSHNQATGLVAGLLLFLTWLAMLARLVASIRAHDVRWKGVLAFGGIAFALTLLSQLNILPVAIYGFDTTDSYNSFITQSILYGLATALAQGLAIAFIVAGAEPEYRRAYGDQVSLTEQFLPDGLRTKRFLLGTVIGLTMAAVFVAYQTVFYLVADRFGAWSPADIPYREMVNTHIPWVVVLLIGFMPAVSEEFTSRAFSIPFLHRLLKRRWVAVVLSALVWGFAHAGYPQQPFWIRGVEVGIAGVAIGCIVLRFGLLPALVWHYTVDALYTALVLLRSSNSYFVLSAAVSVGLMLLPLAGAIFLYLRGRFFIDPESLLNREDAPPLSAPRARVHLDLSPEAQILAGAESSPRYHPVRPARLLGAAAVVLVGLSAYLVPRPDTEPRVDFAITADEARAAAWRHLAAAGVAVDSFRTVVSRRPNWDATVATYRHEHAGPGAVVSLYRRDLEPALWRVRLFRPLAKEEWEVFLRPGDGDLYAIFHHLAEEAPGADLDTLSARAVAEAQLRAAGLDPASFVLKEASSEKLPRRRDHWYTYEAAAGDRRNLDDSRFRCQVHVAGAEPAGLRRFVKLPEEWLREREEDTLWRTALRWVPIAAAIAAALHLLWLLIGRIRTGELGWRWPLCIGGAGSALFLAEVLNQLPTLFADYPTEIAPGMFTLIRAIGVAIVALLAGLLVAGGVAGAAGLFPGGLERLAPHRLLPQLRDAVLLSGLAVAGSLAVRRLAALVAAAVPEAAPPPVPSIPDVDAFWPAVGGLAGAATSALLLPVMAAVAVFYAQSVLRRVSLVVLVLLALGASVAGADAYRVPVFFYELGGFAVAAAATAAAIAWLYRDNLAAYALTGFLAFSVHGGLLLAEQSATTYRVQGWIWLGAAGLVVLWLWRLAMRAAPASADSIP